MAVQFPSQRPLPLATEWLFALKIGFGHQASCLRQHHGAFGSAPIERPPKPCALGLDRQSGDLGHPFGQFPQYASFFGVDLPAIAGRGVVERIFSHRQWIQHEVLLAEVGETELQPNIHRAKTTCKN